MNLLEVTGLSKRFASKRDLIGRVRVWEDAVVDVNFKLEAGETLALVGESGAGKSTTARLALRLIEADAGRVVFDGVDVRALSRSRLLALRRRMQMIFQDPFSSLDPRVTVGESVTEPLLVHEHLSAARRRVQGARMLERVGLSSGDMDRYPREFSGGQLQRIAIARALTLKPSLIVCDEPCAALDVSVRAQVINLMKDLQDEFGIAYLFISHDLGLVEVIADRIAVMSRGRIEETGSTQRIFGAPQSQYTRELIAAIPLPVPRRTRSRRLGAGTPTIGA
jgi:peptide/nickel transport system ATP-binding protein/oligopeptide transport system ATP-binding protein